MTMAKQISRATQAARDSEGTKKRTGRKPTYVVTLSDEDKEFLTSFIAKRNAPAAQVTRAKIALLANEHVRLCDIADELDISTFTVQKWIKRFALYGVGTLADAPRPGTPRTHGDDKITEIIRLTTMTEPPDSSTHWSTNTMAAVAGVSPSTVGRIWRTFGLKPHMVESFTVSNDPEFTEKVRDVAGIYLNPPEAAIVLCVDEKTQVQALDRTQPIRPMVPGVPLRQTTEYKRNGISNLYAALNVASGKVITKMTNAHRAIEFIEFLEIIDKNVPKELGVHVVLDNYAAHKTESVRMWLLAHPRFEFHFTPTYSSWMNQVERWFSALTTKYLQRSVHHSVTELNEGITEWAEAWNKNPKPFIWTKSADEIFASMQKYLGPSVSEQTSD